MITKLILIFVFFGIMIAVGIMCRKKAADVHGFVLGGRNVGPWLTAFAYGTSYFSAVIFVGYAGQFGWKFGIASTWIGLGNAMIGSLMAWVLLGRRTRIMTQHLSSATMPQFFEARFNSRSLKLISSIIIFIFLIPYTASLYNGLSRLFETAFNIDYTVCIIVMAVLTAVYVIAGGYMATAVNDFIQGIIMLFGIVAIIASVLKINGGFTGSLEALANVTPGEGDPATPGIFASFFGPDPLGLLSVVILTSLGTWGLPQMVQKFYAIKSEKDIKKGTIISTVFAVIVAGGCYFLGGFGRLFPDAIKDGFDAIIPAMLDKLSPVIFGIALVLVLSASMSTLSSLVLTSSSTLTLDFIHPVLLKGKSSEKKNLSIIRVFIAVFILLSGVIAIIQYKLNLAFIAQMMGLSWGALAGSFLAPFLYSLYWKRTTKASCIACFIWGSLLMICNMLFKSAFPAFLQSPINCGAFAMLGGMIIVPVISLITRRPDAQHVENVFSCYNKKVVTSITNVLDRDDSETAD
ncbi:MAG: sodium:solute symporter [Clostridiales bacterium]|nr:sodium:solute symporter [Clostridiales bacterium]